MNRIRYTLFVTAVFLALLFGALTTVPVLADDDAPPLSDTATTEEVVSEELSLTTEESAPAEEAIAGEETFSELIESLPEETEVVVTDELGEAVPLATRGRKSGQLRRTALIYGRDGDNYLLVASNGGSDGHPMWYLNLFADPKVELQVGAEKFTARARTANAKEKPRLWKIMSKLFPLYDKYQAKADREIPLVILERVSQ